VIVKAGQIIGTGFTQQVGRAHAEIDAMANARKNSA
jgi:pyrimidine deaminase RibD-like protein